jgi:tight junction protein 1
MIEYATSKPLPLPKSPPQQQPYKPVPPPKPKNYRPPVQQQQQQQYYQPPPPNGFQHSKSFSMADSTYSSHMSNGVSAFDISFLKCIFTYPILNLIYIDAIITQ